MPSNVADFRSFLTEVGVRPEIATALSKADVKSPQDLAALERDDLKKISSNAFLVNSVYPILQKNVFKISMAKNPCQKALDIIWQEAENDGNEPMDTDARVESDATHFVGEGTTTDRSGSGGGHRQTSAPSNTTGTTGVRRERNGMSFNNNGNELNAGGTAVIQSHITTTTTKKAGAPLANPSINITGGNFIQSNVLGQGPVTYNNTNSVINASSNMDASDETLRRRQKQLQEFVYIDGQRIRVADMSWNSGDNDFWLNTGFTMPHSDLDIYSRHLNSNDVYHIRALGSNRALILNNKTFQGINGVADRTGADVDTQNMENAFKQLGFKVQVEQDKTGREMLTLLKEFARHQQNVLTDMVAVYIGSHGERDNQGNDTFLGVDGESIKFSDVKDLFGPRMSPNLKKKPKLFFLQFCRIDTEQPPVPPVIGHPTQESGVLVDSQTHADSKAYAAPTERSEATLASEEEKTMDAVYVFATQPGSKAYRDTEDGSWFVTAMIKVFLDHCKTEDLLSMLTKVNNSVSYKHAQQDGGPAVQISEVVNTLRKKIFFYPGLGK